MGIVGVGILAPQKPERIPFPINYPRINPLGTDASFHAIVTGHFTSVSARFATVTADFTKHTKSTTIA